MACVEPSGLAHQESLSGGDGEDLLQVFGTDLLDEFAQDVAAIPSTIAEREHMQDCGLFEGDFPVGKIGQGLRGVFVHGR